MKRGVLHINQRSEFSLVDAGVTSSLKKHAVKVPSWLLDAPRVDKTLKSDL